MRRLDEIQKLLVEEGLDGWLFYDYRHSDPIAYRVLGLPETMRSTRRWFYLIPARGEPVALIHRIEADHLDTLPGRKVAYAAWEELSAALSTLLRDCSRIAMQYSPMNAIPTISRVDAGTLELVRSLGAEVVSSAVLIQQVESTWTPGQWQQHQAASQALMASLKDAFAFLRDTVAAQGGTDELTLQARLVEAMQTRNLVFDRPPLVAVGMHTAAPHYQPHFRTNAPIGRGDLVLIDLWGKLAEPESVYAEHTWAVFVDTSVPSRYREVFDVVRRARDATLTFLEEALGDDRDVHGWEVDAVCRREVYGLGYGDYFTHRAGHAIGQDLQGYGVNPDDFETHDDRLLLPRTCFSLEPGVYLPGEFGVRTGVNVYLDEDRKVHVTGAPMQNEVLALMA